MEEEGEVVGGVARRPATPRAPRRGEHDHRGQGAAEAGRERAADGRAPARGVKAWASSTTRPVTATISGGDDRPEVSAHARPRRWSTAPARAGAPDGRRCACWRTLRTERVHRRLDEAGEQRAGHAHEEGQRDQRREHQRLARGEVGQAGFAGLRDLAVEHALDHPQHVGGGQDHAQRGQDDQRRAEAPGAEQDQELAHEAVEARAPRWRRADEQEHRGEPGHHALAARRTRRSRRCGGGRRASPPCRKSAPVEMPWLSIW